jgi:hypothetical protein
VQKSHIDGRILKPPRPNAAGSGNFDVSSPETAKYNVSQAIVSLDIRLNERCIYAAVGMPQLGKSARPRGQIPKGGRTRRGRQGRMCRGFGPDSVANGCGISNHLLYRPGLFYSSRGGYDGPCWVAGFGLQLWFRSSLGPIFSRMGTSGATSEWATITSGSK